MWQLYYFFMCPNAPKYSKVFSSRYPPTVIDGSRSQIFNNEDKCYSQSYIINLGTFLLNAVTSVLNNYYLPGMVLGILHALFYLILTTTP